MMDTILKNGAIILQNLIITTCNYSCAQRNSTMQTLNIMTFRLKYF